MNYQDLDVWQVAMDLAVAVYELTAQMPGEEKYTLTKQIRGSATSISANIAEGSGRSGTGELLYFLSVANGSRCEMESRLILANRLGQVGELSKVLELSARVGQMITRLSKVLEGKIEATGKSRGAPRRLGKQQTE